MDTTDVIIGAAVALVVARQLRHHFRAELHAERPATRGDVAHLVVRAANAASGFGVVGAVGGVLSQAGAPARSGWSARTGWVVSVAARIAFLVWLYDVTDGAAFSPFGFAQDLVGGTVWQPVLVVLGLTEVVARGAAVAVRAVTGSGRTPAAEPAVPVSEA